MRIGICGLLGSGKSLFLTLCGIEALELGRSLKSNYKVEGSELINPVELLDYDLNNCTLLLDEAETFLDSRLNRNASRYLTYFFLQSRKRNVDVLYTSQIMGAVDLRLRFITDYIVLAENRKDYFRYTFFQLESPITSIKISLDEAKPFFDKYDTTEIIYPPEFFGKSRDFQFEKVKEIYDSSPTKKSFISLLRNDNPYFTLDLASSLYDLMKNDKEKMARKLLGVELP